MKALLECSGQTWGLNKCPPTLIRPTSHPPLPADMLVLSNVPFSPFQVFLRGNPPPHMPTQDRVPIWLEPVPRFCPLGPWREAEQVRDTGETAPVQDQGWGETLQSRPLAVPCPCTPLTPGHPMLSEPLKSLPVGKERSVVIEVTRTALWHTLCAL